MNRCLRLPSALPRSLFARGLCSGAEVAGVRPRGTKIVATIGPASEEKVPLEACVAAGMNVMRINFSHATVDEFHLRRNNLRNNPAGEYVAVMLDTKGPEIRMGGLKVCKETGDRKAKMTLTAGETLSLTTDAAYNGASDATTLYVDYPRIGEVVSPGDKVLLDDGLISLEVKQVVRAGGEGGALIETEVLNTSEIGERKGVNLPGVKTGLPAMSDKDKEDIKFGMAHDIDMVAASFVRSAEGVHEIRDYLLECHTAAGNDPTDPLPLIISKIESTEALEELPAIVAASDGIMVARGDLGVEVPIHEVITYQKEMVELCLAAGKPVIVATQMLESMQKNPRPTRAEVADVTNAVLDGADAVMLSGESANGQYPSESVGTQADIIAHTEQWALARGMGMGGQFSDDGISMEALGEDDDLDAEADAIGAAACTLAERVGAAAIIVVEHAQGHETRAIVKHRPDCPIISLAPSLKVCRQLNLSRGVQPLYVDDDAAERIYPGDSEGDDVPADRFSICGVVCESTNILGPDDVAVVVCDDIISVERDFDEFFFEDERE